MDSYRTLRKATQELYKEKGSKFFAYAFPIDSKDDVKKYLEDIKVDHPKARHICYAFLIQEGKEDYYIANDDGEPNNSAGMPILGQIRSNNLSHVLIAVVRYFGGTKLGLSGLISAYKESASMCIYEENIIEVEPKSIISFSCSYHIMGQVLAIIDKNNLDAKIEHLDTKAQFSITTKYNTQAQTLALFERIEIDFD